MGGRVIEAELPIGHAHEKYAEATGSSSSPSRSERLEGILAELVSEAEIESGLVAA